MLALFRKKCVKLVIPFLFWMGKVTRDRLLSRTICFSEKSQIVYLQSGHLWQMMTSLT